MAQEVLTGNESIEELQKLYDVFTNRIRLIDEKKANTKPEIYQKVRNEYDAKLLELQVLLEEKGAGMEEALNQALAEKDRILPQLQEVSNTLEELELRVIIGEVTEDEKAAQEQALLAQKSEMESNVAALNEKIQKLSSFVKGKASPAAAITTASPVHSTHKSVSPAPKPVPVAAPPVQNLPESLQPPVSEMEELEKQFASILGSNFGEAPAQPAPAPAPAPAEVMPRTHGIPAFEAPPELPAALQTPEEPAALSEEESHEGELKCPKCAAYNRADNWYCEKCGNELLSAQDLFGGGK